MKTQTYEDKKTLTPGTLLPANDNPAIYSRSLTDGGLNSLKMVGGRKSLKKK